MINFLCAHLLRSGSTPAKMTNTVGTGPDAASKDLPVGICKYKYHIFNVQGTRMKRFYRSQRLVLELEAFNSADFVVWTTNIE